MPILLTPVSTVSKKSLRNFWRRSPVKMNVGYVEVGLVVAFGGGVGDFGVSAQSNVGGWGMRSRGEELI